MLDWTEFVFGHKINFMASNTSFALFLVALPRLIGEEPLWGSFLHIHFNLIQLGHLSQIRISSGRYRIVFPWIIMKRHPCDFIPIPSFYRFYILKSPKTKQRTPPTTYSKSRNQDIKMLFKIRICCLLLLSPTSQRSHALAMRKKISWNSTRSAEMLHTLTILQPSSISVTVDWLMIAFYLLP